MLEIAHADFTKKPVRSVVANAEWNSSRRPTSPLGPPASDDALLRMIAGGDRQAMHLLFSRHNTRVFRFVLRMVGNASAAEDIVSETFLDVWRRAGGFGSRSQASTWLLAIARNKAASARRRPADEPLDEDAFAIEEPADDPEAAFDRKHRSAAIRACLSQLSLAHREVLDLVYYHEKSIEEVAQIIGSPTGTVKTRMHYARQRMRELLNAAGFDAP
jgi:RNA polymerase sigma-70 factor (ECF subfamily)